jgi:hypothetical protein
VREARLNQSAALIQLAGKGRYGRGIDSQVILVSSLVDGYVISFLS